MNVLISSMTHLQSDDLCPKALNTLIEPFFIFSNAWTGSDCNFADGIFFFSFANNWPSLIIFRHFIQNLNLYYNFSSGTLEGKSNKMVISICLRTIATVLVFCTRPCHFLLCIQRELNPHSVSWRGSRLQWMMQSSNVSFKVFIEYLKIYSW